MRGDIFFRLRNTIQSLSTSTWLQVSHAGVQVTIDGLNSPHISHLDVTYEGTDIGECVLLENHKASLRIGNEGAGTGLGWSLHGEIVQARWELVTVPVAMVLPIIQRVEQYLPSLRDLRRNFLFTPPMLVQVQIPVPVLDHWDDRGEPVWAAVPGEAAGIEGLATVNMTVAEYEDMCRLLGQEIPATETTRPEDITRRYDVAMSPKTQERLRDLIDDDNTYDLSLLRRRLVSSAAEVTTVDA